VIGLWRAARGNPILQWEYQRIRRRRWWPGRRFYLFYPVLLGVALGIGVMLLATDEFGVQVAAVAIAAILGLPLGLLVWFLSTALPWIAPALTAATIARERGMGTLDLLRATLLTERSIVLGKLGACMIQLWPGILLLILLSPFQITGQLVGGVGSGLCLCPCASSDGALLALALGFGTEYVWVLVALAVVLGTLRPLAALALNAAVGMFVSVLSRSTGVAVAAAYGAVLAMRAFLWLLMSFMTPMFFLVLDPAIFDPAYAYSVSGPSQVVQWLPSLLPLLEMVVEFAGAVMLVGGAIWWLKRG
jgi:hypothetical protein